MENNVNNMKVKVDFKLALLFIFVVLISFIGGFLGSYFVLDGGVRYVDDGSGIITSNDDLDEVNSISSAVNKVYDSVVVIEVYKEGKLVSTGTGFVYKRHDDKAYLMTNNHVISDNEDIKVLFTNGNEVSAEVVGRDIYSDIAVLSVKDNDNIVTAVMGDGNNLELGDTVFAVGSPEGSSYAGTVTKGIISGKNRVVEVSFSNNQVSDYYMEVLQTDAAINPGNSGGPICNANGEVIGITNMKLVDNTIEGMGFAIPIKDALDVAKVLEVDGKVVRPYIGIELLEINNLFNLWKAGIMIPEGINSGVVVYNVLDDSPAGEAGLEKGDIIIKIGDKNINNMADFRYRLYKYNPFDEIEIVYIRDGEEKNVTIKLGNGE